MNINTIKENKTYIIGIAVMALLVGVVIGNYQQVSKALGYATLDENNGCKSANATTSLNWLRPGTGTTTVQCGTGSAEKVRIFAWLVASSTQTQYDFVVSDSMDNKDFHQRAGSLILNATTTQLTNHSEFQYKFASSTKEEQISVGFGGRGTTSAKLISFEVPTLGANYLRITSSLIDADPPLQTATSSDNGALWLSIITNTQQGR